MARRRRTGQRTVFGVAGGAVASYVSVRDARSRMPEWANADDAATSPSLATKPCDGRKSRLDQSGDGTFRDVATPDTVTCGVERATDSRCTLPGTPPASIGVAPAETPAASQKTTRAKNA